ncbi:hypothetical protein [Fimbriiglobus ruber]|uniref:hypothetical protein n=1 Tax=Fimbriiglobus ruber TaxID=1908690 RepID=UPI00117B5AE3|nr:hypothetical protein [Fimbriiglobus ruber]
MAANLGDTMPRDSDDKESPSRRKSVRHEDDHADVPIRRSRKNGVPMWLIAVLVGGLTIVTLAGVVLVASLFFFGLASKKTMDAAPDPNDFNRTLTWYEQEFDLAYKIGAAKNELASREHSKLFSDGIKSLIGKQIVWHLPVSGVHVSELNLNPNTNQNKQSIVSGNDGVNVVIQKFYFKDRHKIPPDRTMVLEILLEPPLGKTLGDKAALTKIRSGDVVTVRGTVGTGTGTPGMLYVTYIVVRDASVTVP